jgi:hypothetical protein
MINIMSALSRLPVNDNTRGTRQQLLADMMTSIPSSLSDFTTPQLSQISMILAHGDGMMNKQLANDIVTVALRRHISHADYTMLHAQASIAARYSLSSSYSFIMRLAKQSVELHGLTSNEHIVHMLAAMATCRLRYSRYINEAITLLLGDIPHAQRRHISITLLTSRQLVSVSNSLTALNHWYTPMILACMTRALQLIHTLTYDDMVHILYDYSSYESCLSLPLSLTLFEQLLRRICITVGAHDSGSGSAGTHDHYYRLHMVVTHILANGDDSMRHMLHTVVPQSYRQQWQQSYASRALSSSSLSTSTSPALTAKQTMITSVCDTLHDIAHVNAKWPYSSIISPYCDTMMPLHTDIALLSRTGTTDASHAVPHILIDVTIQSHDMNHNGGILCGDTAYRRRLLSSLVVSPLLSSSYRLITISDAAWNGLITRDQRIAYINQRLTVPTSSSSSSSYS